MAQLTLPVTAAIAGTATTNDTLLGTAADEIISGGIGTVAFVADGIDTMIGGEGDDTYIVNETGDVVTELAGEGTDTVWSSVTYTLAAELENIAAAGSTATTLTGNAKDNILDGTNNTAINTLVGLAGNDTYYIGSNDLITEAVGGGIDKIIASSSINLTAVTNFTSLAAAGAIENVTLTGATVGNITGNALNNRLSGSTAINTIIGGAGNDILDTGAGGADILQGDAGNDTFIIRTGATATITDNAGIDLVQSFVTANVSALVAGQGIENVTLLGSTAINATGNTLANILIGNNAVNTLTGDAGNDILTGNGGDDVLVGGAGNDTLNGGAGTNSLQGGAGNDIYNVTSATDTFSGELNTVGETDTVNFSGASGTLTVGNFIETINLTGTNAISATVAGTTIAHTMTGNTAANTLTGGDGIDNINGGDGDDILIGNAGNDNLTGGNGNDTIRGNAGNDTLNGGAGANILNGGAGADIYNVTSATNTFEAAAEAASTALAERDTVNFNVTTGTLTFGVNGDNIEVINLLGTAGIGVDLSATTVAHTITGNTGANTIIGGSGVDTINGGAGADAMTGNDGSDTFTVDNTGDTVIETVLNGDTDVVNITATAGGTFDFSVNGVGVENININNSAATNVTGNDQINTIIGNAFANTINGNAGNDIISAGAGNDIINGGADNDTITGGSGRDVVTTGAGLDIIKFAAGVADTVAAAASSAGVDLYSDLSLTAGTGDKIDLTAVVANKNLTVTGTVNEATFIADMNTLLAVGGGAGFNAAVAGDIAAAVVDTATKDYLAVDLDGNGTFTATDFVIEITGSSFAGLTTASFM